MGEVDEAKELKRREVAEKLEAEQELVETLLDVYNARLDSLNDRISELATSIETTQVTLELQLDNERNRLARFELTLNMAGLCIGMSAMVSGFFGMNLVSGVENAWAASGSPRSSPLSGRPHSSSLAHAASVTSPCSNARGSRMCRPSSECSLTWMRWRCC